VWCLVVSDEPCSRSTGFNVILRDVEPTSRIMVVAVMVSMVAFLDGTVVNLALPAIERDLGGGLPMQQWVVDAYLLSMGALILPGGSISDLFGRVRVMRFGLAAFGVGSVLAATASSPAILVAARALQGLGAAFLVPGSLALINSTFDRAAQPAAIGTWTAWTGTAFALGPLLGGLAVDMLTWRWIYALSAIPMVLGYALTYWLCPMQAPAEHSKVDVRGAVSSAVGLASGVYGLIESQQRGWTDPIVAASIAGGIAMMLLFVVWEHRATEPMVPLRLLTIREFAGANLATALVYGGLALGSLVISLYIQEFGGYSATVAGLTTLPIPIMSFLFARHVGAAAARLGVGIFLVVGPTLAGTGLIVIALSAGGASLAAEVMPGMIMLAAGLVCTVTPLTSFALSAVEPERSGLASAINNAVSRLSSLITVACMGLIAAGSLTEVGFARLLQVSAALFFTGAMAGGATVSRSASRIQTVPCEIAALCRDRSGVQPALTSRG
jgi:EmrB/QacA subfamily drug resistance transporter